MCQRHGVTLCFQFVSAAAAAAAAMTFTSHVKTFWARPYIFRPKKVWVWENVLSDLWVTMTQGQGCDIYKQKFACLQYKVRTTQLIIISWILPIIFFRKFQMCFFKVKHFIGHISGMVGTIDVKRKGGASVGYWVNYVTLTFDFNHDLGLWFLMVKFQNSCNWGIVI